MSGTALSASRAMVMAALEVWLERLDRDRHRRIGLRAPQLRSVEAHCVEPLGILAELACIAVGERDSGVWR
jgi:hypothetical protein